MTAHGDRGPAAGARAIAGGSARRPGPSYLVAAGTGIVALHLAGWGLAWFTARSGWPALMGLAMLAYVFGLRHAFDADHIAAIDNTTRRLMHAGGRPLGVGLWFSLGHSTIVLAMTIGVALAARHVAGILPHVEAAGDRIGPLVSGTFLCLMGLANVLVLKDILVRRSRRTAGPTAGPPEAMPAGGFVTRWLGSGLRLVRRPRQMYLVGLLFGLGFDTATEIAVLATAGVAASEARPMMGVLALPLVFAAGMSLMDTADGILMCGAYGWAGASPGRTRSYNLAVTGLSAGMALGLGTLQLVSSGAVPVTRLQAPVSALLAAVNTPAAGGLVTAAIAMAWIGAAVASRARRSAR